MTNRMIKFLIACVMWAFAVTTHAQHDFLHASSISEIEFKTAYKYLSKQAFATEPAHLSVEKRTALQERLKTFLQDRLPENDMQVQSEGWQSSSSCYFLPLNAELTYWVNTSSEQGLLHRSRLVDVDESHVATWEQTLDGPLQIHFYNSFMFESTSYIHWNLELKPYADFRRAVFVAEGGALYFSAVCKSGPEQGKYVFMKLKKVELPGENEGVKLAPFTPSSEAVVLTDEVKVLNSLHKLSRTVRGQAGKFVKIIGRQTNWESPSQDASVCQQFNYVQVRNNRFIGWMDGRDVYALVDAPVNFETTVEGKHIRFTATHNFTKALEAFDEEQTCERFNPTVFNDGVYRGLVKLKPQTVPDASGGYQVPFKQSPYFEISMDANQSMTVRKVEKSGNDYLVTLDIRYLDDEGRITYRLYKDNDTYMAEPVEYMIY